MMAAWSLDRASGAAVTSHPCLGSGLLALDSTANATCFPVPTRCLIDFDHIQPTSFPVMYIQVAVLPLYTYKSAYKLVARIRFIGNFEARKYRTWGTSFEFRMTTFPFDNLGYCTTQPPGSDKRITRSR